MGSELTRLNLCQKRIKLKYLIHSIENKFANMKVKCIVQILYKKEREREKKKNLRCV